MYYYAAKMNIMQQSTVNPTYRGYTYEQII